MNEVLIRKIVTRALVAGAVVIVGGLGFALWQSLSDGPRPDLSGLEPVRVSVPDSENGFLDLNGIHSWKETYDEGDLHYWLVRDGWDQKKVDALLVQNQPALALLDASLAKPGFQYKEASLPHAYSDLSRLGKLADIKILSAIDHWNKKQQKLALKEILQALETGRRLETCEGSGECTFKEGVNAEIHALDNLGRFAGEASEGQLRGMQSAVEKYERDADHTEALRNALKDEAAHFNWEFDRIVSGKADVSHLQWGKPVRPIDKIFQPNNTHRMFVDTIRQLIHDAPLTYDKIDKEPGAWKLVNKMSPRRRILSFNIGGYEVFTQSFSDCESWSATKCRIVTQAGMTRTLIAVRMYWLDNGKLPATLDDLVPGYLKTVPLDAFNGEPLRYSPLHKVIYSVGRFAVPGVSNLPGEDIPGLESQPKAKIGW